MVRIKQSSQHGATGLLSGLRRHVKEHAAEAGPDAADAVTVPPPGAWARRPRLLSVVVPVYREEDGITHFTESLLAVLGPLGLPFEVLFVEDDSPDGSLEKIRQLHQKYPAVIRALSLSRRFGHQASLAAGFRFARGDVVLCMDSDMQHPPALLPLLLWKWSQGYQLVYTRRRRQRGRSMVKELASRLFYLAINGLSEVPFEDGTADFRVMDRVVVDALNQFSERALFFRGLVRWAGFRQVAVEYEAPERFAGTSSYTWGRMLRLALDAIFTFSLVPLRATYYLGGLSLLATCVYALWATIRWLCDGSQQPGYTSLVLLMTFIGSIHLLCLGIVGEYVGRIHEQIKQRPLFLAKEWIGLSGPQESRPA